LNPVFELVRYPDSDEGIPLDRVNLEIAEDHVRIARSIMERINRQL